MFHVPLCIFSFTCHSHTCLCLSMRIIIFLVWSLATVPLYSMAYILKRSVLEADDSSNGTFLWDPDDWSPQTKNIVNSKWTTHGVTLFYCCKLICFFSLCSTEVLMGIFIILLFVLVVIIAFCPRCTFLVDRICCCLNIRHFNPVLNDKFDTDPETDRTKKFDQLAPDADSETSTGNNHHCKPQMTQPQTLDTTPTSQLWNNKIFC